eukprot:TRINITY_DN19807_c0_g1_i1.p1 TRINITY_DN19807_c0_g1~~TRINITY_DN19807_c0_g1_i1.p1  ORF type:complete len:214 (-),score=30.48 TRINITY_DN19807_c0_g1_i1:38-679(-)
MCIRDRYRRAPQSALVPGEIRQEQRRTSFVTMQVEKKDSFLCTFCGGKKCKQENWLNNPQSVIQGLDSDWITDNILAMQRPSSRLVKEFNIPEQFLKHGIKSIFCLQEPGEHPKCGDGIHKSNGLSYLPEEEFFKHGIFFYNMGWKDHNITNYEFLLKLIDLVHFALTTGDKVAVHCHAGRGRTAILICAWLIYDQRMSADCLLYTSPSPRDS